MVRKRTVAVTTGAIAATVGLLAAPLTVMADQVILDDLIVDGSICAGFDCVNGESFGFDTLRLKENNLRIKFQDTSTSASFPSNDWQITANDTSNGGRNMFAIDDIDGGRTPFLIEAGARTSSLYVDSSGRVGLGTSDPVVALHVQNGNTPTLRLHQDGTSGFTQQVWDVAGNEANFFVRDATNGSALPFRIEPAADTNSLVIDANNSIGMGTNSPAEDLHIRSGDNPRIRIEDSSPGANAKWDIGLQNAGDLIFFNDTTIQWRLFTDGKFRYTTVTNAPTGAAIGDVYFDDSGAACFYDGTGWVEMGAFAGSCA